MLDFKKFLNDWKDNIFLVVLFCVLLIASLLLFGRFAALWHAYGKSHEQMIAVREDYNRFMIKNNEIPSNQQINYYEEYAEQLKKLYGKIHGKLLSKRKPDKKISALRFKQELFTRQKKLNEQAKSNSISIPMDLGFKDLMGDKIPLEKELPLLSLQLDIITLFVNDFFDSGIERLESIMKHGKTKKSKYKAQLPFTLTFKSDMKGVVQFLDKLNSKKDIFIVNTVNVDTLPLSDFRKENNLGYLLEVTVKLDYIEFK